MVVKVSLPSEEHHSQAPDVYFSGVGLSAAGYQNLRGHIEWSATQCPHHRVLLDELAQPEIGDFQQGLLVVGL